MILISTILLVFFLYLWEKKHTKKLANASDLQAVFGRGIAMTVVRYIFLFIMVFCYLALSFGLPQFGAGTASVIVFDISESMLADDIEPTRLATAKNIALQEFRSQNRIGFVSFSGSLQETILPTSDKQLLAGVIDAVDVQKVQDAEPGTALYDALETAQELLTGSGKIILITDGGVNIGSRNLDFDTQIDVYAVGKEEGGYITRKSEFLDLQVPIPPPDYELLGAITKSSGGELKKIEKEVLYEDIKYHLNTRTILFILLTLSLLLFVVTLPGFLRWTSVNNALK